jgi:superfamily II DNA or RNA helicase
MSADAPEHVRDAYLEHAEGRRALIFTPTVAVARSMAEVLAAAGVPSAWLSGETPREERADTLARLRSGQLRAVANCAVLTEGFDCPPLDCVIVARPTRSSSLYAQMIGRGTRLHPDKQDCLVLDVVGQAGRHDLVTTAGLFGLSPRTLAGRTVTEGLAEQQREAEAAEAARQVQDQVRLVSQPVDLLGRGPLPSATENRARWLTDPHAPWRRRPASTKQLDVLARRGVRTWLGMTAGEASTLISARMRGRAS